MLYGGGEAEGGGQAGRQLSSDESYLVIKVREVRIAKEVKRSDGW